MSELLREAFRSYKRSRPSDTEDEAETGRRLKASLAECVGANTETMMKPA